MVSGHPFQIWVEVAARLRSGMEYLKSTDARDVQYIGFVRCKQAKDITENMI